MKINSYLKIAVAYHVVLAILVAPQCSATLTKIIGGTPTTVNEYPYFAVSTGNSTYWSVCGATLIWNDILISAAHCGAVTFSGGIRLGGNTLSGGTRYSVNQSLLHPFYDAARTENDIMLIKINGNVPGPFVQLNVEKSIPFTGQVLTAVGYGSTVEGGAVSNTQYDVDFYAVSYETCRATYGTFIKDDVMVCSGGIPEGGKDTCQGDSGGPIFLKGTNVQIGITSFGYGCARPNTPSVNARVSGFSNWIQSSICSLSSFPPASCFTAATVSAPVATKSPIGPSPTVVAPITPPQTTKSPIIPPLATKAPILPPPTTKSPVMLPSPVMTPVKAPVAPTTCIAKRGRCTISSSCCSKVCSGRFIKVCK